MFDEKLATGNSVFHRLDPRVKIIAAVFFSVVAAISDRWIVTGGALFISFAMLILARLPFKPIFDRMLIVNSFVIFLWFFLPFSSPGETVFSLGPLVATREGILFALEITLKSNAIVIASIVLLSTSTIFSLVHAMNHMKFPGKLIHLMFFTFRYVHVLLLEYERLKCAMKVRCFAPSTNMHTYRSYAYLVGMLLVNSYDRSERVYEAMKCRGFHGEYRVLKHFHMHSNDFIIAALLGAVIILLAYFQWGPALF